MSKWAQRPQKITKFPPKHTPNHRRLQKKNWTKRWRNPKNPNNPHRLPRIPT